MAQQQQQMMAQQQSAQQQSFQQQSMSSSQQQSASFQQGIFLPKLLIYPIWHGRGEECLFTLWGMWLGSQ